MVHMNQLLTSSISWKMLITENILEPEKLF